MGRKMERQNSKIKKSSPNGAGKQISIFTIIFVLIILAVFVGIYFGVRYAVITLKYKTYTDKMESYGFDTLYNNKKATAVQKVSNDELIKVVIGSITNTKDISQIYHLADKNVPDTKNWYAYSKYIGIINAIKETELEQNANRIDAILLTVSTLETVLNINVEQAQLDMSEEKLKDYSEVEQALIAKAVTLGIIENKTSELSDKDIIKGELNKIIVQMAEKYATMYYGSVNNEQKINIVTDKEKLPGNYEDYPYIVDNISNEVYEMGYKIRTQSSFKTPKDTYKIMGYLYSQTDELITRYFSNILNVDYSTITINDFYNSIKNDVTYKITEQDVSEYVQYVKQHNIKLQGEAIPLLPIMYNNGEQYVVRTKITFKVMNSDTKYNLLFGDEANSVKYNSNEITLYVDLPLGMTLNSNSQLINICCLAEKLANPTQLVIIEE